MLRYRNKLSGFTLLELIISIAILSVGIVAVMQAITYSVRSAGLSCDMASVIFLAQDKIQELEYKETSSLIGSQPKESQGSQDKFNWQYALNLVTDLNLYKLDFDVGWKRQNRQESLHLETYLRK